MFQDQVSGKSFQGRWSVLWFSFVGIFGSLAMRTFVLLRDNSVATQTDSNKLPFYDREVE